MIFNIRVELNKPVNFLGNMKSVLFIKIKSETKEAAIKIAEGYYGDNIKSIK